jgi:hypothetical protein
MYYVYNYVNLFPDSLYPTGLHCLQEIVPSGNPSDCCLMALLKVPLFSVPLR